MVPESSCAGLNFVCAARKFHIAVLTSARELLASGIELPLTKSGARNKRELEIKQEKEDEFKRRRTDEDSKPPKKGGLKRLGEC